MGVSFQNGGVSRYLELRFINFKKGGTDEEEALYCCLYRSGDFYLGARMHITKQLKQHRQRARSLHGFDLVGVQPQEPKRRRARALDSDRYGPQRIREWICSRRRTGDDRISRTVREIERFKETDTRIQASGRARSESLREWLSRASRESGSGSRFGVARGVQPCERRQAASVSVGPGQGRATPPHRSASRFKVS